MRQDAIAVGADIPNFHQLATILIRAAGLNANQLMTVLQPLGGRMPQTQRQFEELFNSMRQYGHLFQNAPDNISSAVQGRGGGGGGGQYFAETLFTNNGYQAITGDSAPPGEPLIPENNPWPDPMYGTSENTREIGQGAYGNSSQAETPHIFTLNQYDSGTDSDTISSVGEEEIDFTDLAHLTERQREQELFAAYEFHKRRCRKNQ